MKPNFCHHVDDLMSPGSPATIRALNDTIMGSMERYAGEDCNPEIPIYVESYMH